MDKLIPKRMFFTKGVGYHRNKLQSFELALRNALMGRRPYDFQHRVVRPDGQIRVVRSLGDISMDAHGRAMSITGVFQDVTDTCETQDALVRTEATLGKAVSQTALGDGPRAEAVIAKIIADADVERGQAGLGDLDLEEERVHRTLRDDVLLAVAPRRPLAGVPRGVGARGPPDASKPRGCVGLVVEALGGPRVGVDRGRGTQQRENGDGGDASQPFDRGPWPGSTGRIGSDHLSPLSTSAAYAQPEWMESPSYRLGFWRSRYPGVIGPIDRKTL